VFEPLTMLQCCPTSDGAAAAVLASEAFVKKHHLEAQAIEIAGMSMATDLPQALQGSMISMVGGDMVRKAANEVYKQAGLRPEDAQVVELHDCFSCNELVTYEALGLCGTGEAAKLIERGDNTYGGKWVVNPSGGLISKGHPLGATGLAQCSELCWQLRGMCGNRQVSNATVALQHNIGLGGAAVVAMYRHGFPEQKRPFPAGKPNPAIDDNTPYGEEAPAPAPAAAPTATGGAVTVASVFGELKKKVEADPTLVQKVAGVYVFVVGNESWTVDLKNGSGKVEPKAAEKPDCTVTMKEADFLALVSGQLDPQGAFMKGLLKISGNMSFAMKLGLIFNSKKKAAL